MVFVRSKPCHVSILDVECQARRNGGLWNLVEPCQTNSFYLTRLTGVNVPTHSYRLIEFSLSSVTSKTPHAFPRPPESVLCVGMTDSSNMAARQPSPLRFPRQPQQLKTKAPRNMCFPSFPLTHDEFRNVTRYNFEAPAAFPKHS